MNLIRNIIDKFGTDFTGEQAYQARQALRRIEMELLKKELPEIEIIEIKPRIIMK